MFCFAFIQNRSTIYTPNIMRFTAYTVIPNKASLVLGSTFFVNHCETLQGEVGPTPQCMMNLSLSLSLSLSHHMISFQARPRGISARPSVLLTPFRLHPFDRSMSGQAVTTSSFSSQSGEGGREVREHWLVAMSDPLTRDTKWREEEEAAAACLGRYSKTACIISAQNWHKRTCRWESVSQTDGISMWVEGGNLRRGH